MCENCECPMKKIYTKTGDRGETVLLGGAKVKKTFSLIHALGDVDELNSFVGFARSYLLEHEEVGVASEDSYRIDTLSILKKIQRDLYRMSAELIGVRAREGEISSADVLELERVIDSLPLDVSEFVPPGAKGEFSARLHVCRSVCRRAERRVLAALARAGLGEKPFIMQYLNRLSDLFFAIAEC